MSADSPRQQPSRQRAAAASDRDLVVELSRDLVASLAPEEMTVFRSVSVAFYETPRRLSSESKDDMLGFGAEDAVVLLTPVVLSVMGQVVDFLRSEIAKALPQVVSNVADEGIRGLFRKFHGRDEAASAVPALTEEQLFRVRSIAFEKARQSRITENRARLLADAVVGSLVLGS